MMDYDTNAIVCICLHHSTSLATDLKKKQVRISVDLKAMVRMTTNAIAHIARHS
jgi:hypothetical protein